METYHIEPFHRQMASYALSTSEGSGGTNWSPFFYRVRSLPTLSKTGAISNERQTVIVADLLIVEIDFRDITSPIQY